MKNLPPYHNVHEWDCALAAYIVNIDAEWMCACVGRNILGMYTQTYTENIGDFKVTMIEPGCVFSAGNAKPLIDAWKDVPLFIYHFHKPILPFPPPAECPFRHAVKKKNRCRSMEIEKMVNKKWFPFSHTFVSLYFSLMKTVSGDSVTKAIKILLEKI
jgi:hypothetical protein